MGCHYHLLLRRRKAAPALGLALALACPVVLTSCGDDGEAGSATVSCRRVEQVVGRDRPARLTGDPSFSLPRAAAGDDLSLSIPVNEHTQAVSVSVRSENQEVGVSVRRQETPGAETVVFALNTNGLPAAVYFLRVATLEGATLAENSSYGASGPSGTYRLGVSGAAERTLRCITEIPVVSFTLIGDDP